MWILVSILCAFSLSIRDISIKLLSKKHNIYFLVLAGTLTTSITVFSYEIIKANISLSSFFNHKAIPYLIVMLPLEISATLLYFNAIKYGEISSSLPFLSFTPALIPFFSYPILGELPSGHAYIGVLLVSIGGYIMFFSSIKDWILPFKAIFKNRGSIMMLTVAIIYAITSVLGKKLVISVGRDNMSAFYPLLTSILLLLSLVISGKLNLSSLHISSPLLFVLMVVSGAAMIILHFIAISMINVSYMISIKRTSSIFSLILAAIFLKEKDIIKRFMGSLIMIVGVFVVIYGTK